MREDSRDGRDDRDGRDGVAGCGFNAECRMSNEAWRSESTEVGQDAPSDEDEREGEGEENRPAEPGTEREGDQADGRADEAHQEQLGREIVRVRVAAGKEVVRHADRRGSGHTAAQRGEPPGEGRADFAPVGEAAGPEAENKKRDSGHGPNRRNGSDDEFLPVRLDAGSVEESEKQVGHQAIQPDAADQSECVVSFHGTIQGSASSA